MHFGLVGPRLAARGCLSAALMLHAESGKSPLCCMQGTESTTGTSNEQARTWSTAQTTSRERTTGEELSTTETESNTLTQVRRPRGYTPS